MHDCRHRTADVGRSERGDRAHHRRGPSRLLRLHLAHRRCRIHRHGAASTLPRAGTRERPTTSTAPWTAPSTTAFYDALLAAEAAESKEWEKLEYFEGCLPIEVLARRGRDTLRFGPMKPVGLRDPRTGKNALGRGATAQGEPARRQLQPGGFSESFEVRRAGAGAAADSGPRKRALSALRADSPQHVHLRASAARRNAAALLKSWAPHPSASEAADAKGGKATPANHPLCRPDLRRRGLHRIHRHGHAGGHLCRGARARRGARSRSPRHGPRLAGSLHHARRSKRTFSPPTSPSTCWSRSKRRCARKIRDKKERHRIQCERALAAFDAWWAATISCAEPVKRSSALGAYKGSDLPQSFFGTSHGHVSPQRHRLHPVHRLWRTGNRAGLCAAVDHALSRSRRGAVVADGAGAVLIVAGSHARPRIRQAFRSSWAGER